MRYIWELTEQYLQPAPTRQISQTLAGRLGHSLHRQLKRLGLAMFCHPLRDQDLKFNEQVDVFAANSRNVAQRIERCYQRPAQCIYSPIDDEYFSPAPAEELTPPPFYLVASALVPYKRVDLAVAAFRDWPDRQLIVIGTGPEEARLKEMAGAALGSRIHFLGWADDQALRWHYRHCQALIFPGEEDFGLVPLEVQACGRPVIAYGAGGALETIIPLPRHPEGELQATGLFFHEQSTQGLMEGLERFEANQAWFSPEVMRQHASGFNQSRFHREILELAETLVNDRRKRLARG